MKFKRIILMILDSLGVGEAEDASNFGDSGANTLGHIIENYELFVPNLAKIGFLDTVKMSENENTEAYYTIAKPINAGKDTINAHYEILGIKNEIPFKTFNEGFPPEIISKIEKITGRSVIGNICSQDEAIIKELGERQVNYGSLIVYTSSDSDLQIAAHEDYIPMATLHNYCEKIRKLSLAEDWKIARIIARPFTGNKENYHFVQSGRKDYAINPPKRSILDDLNIHEYDVIGIGKINDILNSKGINKTIKANSNIEAINKLTEILDKKFTGLCIVNLCDFDALYGNLRDVESYGKTLEDLDVDIPIILNKLDVEDLLIITADHGNDPTFIGNDHTREKVPVILYSRNFKEPKRIGEFKTLANIGATIADNFDIDLPEIGNSVLEELE